MSRVFHRLYAWFNNYFWLPCPKCGKSFGGHESGDGVLFDDIDGWQPGHGWSRKGMATCPDCPGQWVRTMNSEVIPWRGPQPLQETGANNSKEEWPPLGFRVNFMGMDLEKIEDCK